MENQHNHPKDDKWPWSITDREFGAIEQELKEVRHDLRNLKMLVDESGLTSVTKEDVVNIRENLGKLNQNFNTLKKEIETVNIDISALEKLSIEFSQFKTKVYTSFFIILLLASGMAWMIEVVLK